jgi:HNH endonuclease
MCFNKTAMPNQRPPIPNQVKRAVRQRCGFGCVVCGLPLYDYDHVIPWSEVQEHDSDNIVLLCNQHHREKTTGLLSVDVVTAASVRPYNLQTGESRPYDLHYHGTNCRSVIGSNTHEWPQLGPNMFTVPLLIDDTPIVLFRVEDEHLLLTAQLFNRSNQLLAQIVDNQLVYSMSSWDVEFVGRELTIRGGPGDVFVRMKFETPATVLIDRGHIWRNGIELDITPERLLLANNQNTVSHCTATNCTLGIGVGDCPEGIGGAMRFDSRRVEAPRDPMVEARVLKLVGRG